MVGLAGTLWDLTGLTGPEGIAGLMRLHGAYLYASQMLSVSSRDSEYSFKGHNFLLLQIITMHMSSQYVILVFWSGDKF